MDLVGLEKITDLAGQNVCQELKVVKLDKL